MDEKIREEAITRLKILQEQGLEEAVVQRYIQEKQISYSESVTDGILIHQIFDQNPELLAIKKEVEQEFDVHVFYATFQKLGFTCLLTMLAVDSYVDEWEYEKENMQEHRATAYAYDLEARWSEAGEMQYKIVHGCIVRES